MSKKIIKPLNPLIYATARDMAAETYEAGRSKGMTSKYKNARQYAIANIEKFIPIAVKTLLMMLKPTSTISEFMKYEVYEALTDPINDPNLINGKGDGKALPDINVKKLAQILKQYDKNKINVPVTSGKPNLKGSTSLSNPFAPKPN